MDPPLIAVLAFIAFINGLLSWFCALVGYDGVTIEFILGKIFIPFAWFMGVEYDNLESGFYSTLIFSFTFLSWIGMAELLRQINSTRSLRPRNDVTAQKPSGKPLQGISS